MCRDHSISESVPLLGFLRMLLLHEFALDDVECPWRRAKYCHTLVQNLTLTLYKSFLRLQTTVNGKNNSIYAIKGLLHWYRWILSLIGISTDARKLATFNISTWDNIHRYQCNNPIEFVQRMIRRVTMLIWHRCLIRDIPQTLRRHYVKIVIALVHFGNKFKVV